MSNSMLGIYTIALSIFGVFNTILASGTPIAVSQIVSIKRDNQQKNDARMVTAGLIYATTLAIIICFCVVFFADFFNNILDSSNVYLLLLVMLPAVISTGIYAAPRGYLWGKEKYLQASLVELFEQVLRIVLCVIIFLTVKDMSEVLPPGISFGIAGVLSTLLGLFFYFRSSGRFAKPKNAFRTFFKSSTPITTVRFFGSIMIPIITILLPFRLISLGYSEDQALSQLGIMLGMTFPLLSIPSTVIGSLAMALIPKVTNLNHDKNFHELDKQISNSLVFSIVLIFLIIPSFLALGEPICEFLFNNSRAGYFLSLASWIMIPMGISQVTGSVLNSLGQEIKGLLYYMMGNIALVLIVFFMPVYVGIEAIIYGIGIANLIAGMLNLRKINSITNSKNRYTKTIVKLTAICIPCSLFTYFFYNLIVIIFPKMIAVMLACASSVVVTLVLYAVFNVFDYKIIKSKYENIKNNKPKSLAVK